ncbi:MAG: hypothetical protein AAFQ82_14895 [Myxococcota bacterium]
MIGALLTLAVMACDWVGPEGYRFAPVPTTGYGAMPEVEIPYHTNWSTCVARERGQEEVELVVEVQDRKGRWVESERRSKRLQIALEPEHEQLRFRVSDRNCQAAFPDAGGYPPSWRMRATKARIRLEGIKELKLTTQPLPLYCRVGCPKPFTRPSVRVKNGIVSIDFAPRSDFVDCALQRKGALALRLFVGATEEALRDASVPTFELTRYTLAPEKSGRRELRFQIPQKKLCRAGKVVAFELGGESPFTALTLIRQFARSTRPCD